MNFFSSKELLTELRSTKVKVVSFNGVKTSSVCPMDRRQRSGYVQSSRRVV